MWSRATLVAATVGAAVLTACSSGENSANTPASNATMPTAAAPSGGSSGSSGSTGCDVYHGPNYSSSAFMDGFNQTIGSLAPGQVNYMTQYASNSSGQDLVSMGPRLTC